MQFTTLLSLLLLLFFFTTTTTPTHAHNIRRLLAEHPDFSTFNHYLTLTHLANDINSRTTITVCAVDNVAISELLSKHPSIYTLKNILSLHVLLDCMQCDYREYILLKDNIDGGLTVFCPLDDPFKAFIPKCFHINISWISKDMSALADTPADSPDGYPADQTADKNAGVRFGGGRIAVLGLSLWLAFTLLTLGNDLTPTNHVPDLIFSIFIVFGRVILFPLLFVIIQVVLQAVMGKTKEMQLRRDMELWMSRRQLPPDLIQRVEDFMDGQEEMEVMKLLPEGLRREIKLHREGSEV